MKTEKITRLIEFINANPAIKMQWPELIKLVFDSYFEYQRRHCAICDKVLSQNEIKAIRAIDFWHTCLKHQQYATKIQIDVVRAELGLGERPPVIKYLSCKILNTN